MGRTYSFEPFRSQQPAQVFKGSGPRLGNDESKTTLAKDEEQATTELPSTHYGQAHAETVKRYRKRAAARKVAAKSPARPAAKKTAKPAATSRAPARKQAASAEAPRMTTARQPASEKTTAKAPARKGTASSAVKVASLGRKVLSRAAVAAKKSVAKVVKTATTRKPTKKR
jgi:hypothetical protein